MYKMGWNTSLYRFRHDGWRLWICSPSLPLVRIIPVERTVIASLASWCPQIGSAAFLGAEQKEKERSMLRTNFPSCSGSSGGSGVDGARGV